MPPPDGSAGPPIRREQSRRLTSGVASAAGDADKGNKWSSVYDELRSHQCLSSVINDPRGKGLFRNQWEGISDLWEAAAEIVEEIGEAREAENQGTVDAALVARTDALIGPVPELPDFAPYLDTFADLWEVYHKHHRAHRHRVPGAGVALAAGAGSAGSGAEDSAGCDAHRDVPHEYFRTDFKLEHHAIFRQSLQTSIERQEELNAELTGHLDKIEVALFEQIRRAQRDQLFDSMSRLNQPLQEDLTSTLSVVAKLRGRLGSVQRRQLRNGLAVGRLARRKRRAEEVLQRLECLEHVQESLPSIRMLLQGQDYVTALRLLETTGSAVESSLKGVASAKPSSAKLAGFAGTFDRSVEADFVHHSAEAILVSAGGSASSSSRGAPAAAATAGDAAVAPPPLRGADRLRSLCWCLARRELLRPTLGASLRDVVLTQLKKVLKNRAKQLLEELTALQQEQEARLRAEREQTAAASTQAAAEESAEADAAADGDGPAASDGGGADPSPSPTSSVSPRREATQGIAAAICALTFDGFLAFWRRILQDVIEVGERYCEFASLIQAALHGGPGQDFGGGGATSSSEASALRPAGGDGAEADLLRLFEVVLNSYLQKIGVLLQTRQGEHRSLKADVWRVFLRVSYDALDRVKDLQDQCRQRLGAKDVHASVDVRAGMRTILYAQTKAIVEEFDKRCVERLECALEQERWERTDVPSQYKTILDQLLGKEHCKDLDAVDQGVERYLHVDGSHFLVVPAALTLIQLLNDYLRLCTEFETLPEVIVQRMCSLLKLFNGRTHQLVLLGQAVHKETVKKINASNLALCSQCCGLVAQILPSLQAHMHSMFAPEGAAAAAAAASSGSTASARNAAALLVADLSKIATEYNDHRTALFGKLSTILVDRYTVHAKKWFSAPHQESAESASSALWGGQDAAAAAPAAAGESADEPRGPLEALAHEALDGFAKEVMNMYRVLLKHLSGDNVRSIFAKAFEDIAMKFEQRLTQELAAPSPPYEDKLGRSLGDRFLVDVAFMHERMEKLSGISTPLQRLLVDLVSHLQTRLPAGEPLKALHPAALEALQRAGRLPR